MKYSIVIVTYKAVEALRRCLDSINASSIEDAEIIIWDNSPDPLFHETPERAWSPRVPIYAYYNGNNYGFAEGCNMGAKQARGEFLIFLNPDTQVFGDWADRMERYFAYKGPKPIGAIGPVSNYVAGIQNAAIIAALNIPHDPASPSLVATKLLIGFCLMMPSQVWTHIGGMDKELFLGCDDLDLSMRLREAGYELGIATDVFVHHDGHQSMEAAGSEVSMQLVEETSEKFRTKLLAKYGKPELVPSSEELWGCAIFYTGPMNPMKLSIVMIVRDEDANLVELLPQLAFADEIVIVDTKPRGYHFDSIIIEHWAYEIAPALEGKVVGGTFGWNDDFAAARNHALSLATGDYVLWIDADDRVPKESAALIRAIIDIPGPLTAQKKCHFAFLLKDKGIGGNIVYVMQQRMFPRIPGLHWEHTIHENYGDIARAMKLALVAPKNIIIEHHGYDQLERLKRKQERNLRILNKMPNSPHKLMHVGNSLLVLGAYETARIAYRSLIEMDSSWPGGLDDSLLAHTRYMIASTYYKEFMAAMDLWQKTHPERRGAFPVFPAAVLGHTEDNPKPDALFLLAEHYFFAGDLQKAKELFTLYSSVDITDFFGTGQEFLQPAALGRIDAITRMEAQRIGHPENA